MLRRVLALVAAVVAGAWVIMATFSPDHTVGGLLDLIKGDATPAPADTTPSEPTTGRPAALVAIDLQSGQARWQVPIPDPGDQLPTVLMPGDATVIAVSAAPEVGAVAVNVSDGSRAWQTTLGEDSLVDAGQADGAVVLAMGNGDTWRIQGLNPSNGKKVWDAKSTSAFAPMIDGNEVVYVDGGDVHVKQASDGAEVSVVQNATSGPTFLVDPDHVYLTGPDFGVKAIAISDAASSWTQRLVQAGNLAVGPGYLVAWNPTQVDGKAATRITAVEAVSGSVMWQRTISGQADVRPSDAGLFVLVSKTTFSLDVFTGKNLWKYPGDATVLASTASGALIPRGKGVSLIDPETGKPAWTVNGLPKAPTQVVVSDATILAASDGAISAIDPTTGTITWTTKFDQTLVGNVVVIDGTVIFAARSAPVVSATTSAG
jgi:outer membrane protein assembly factor BamB